VIVSFLMSYKKAEVNLLSNQFHIKTAIPLIHP
jgi:hypothetical protein